MCSSQDVLNTRLAYIHATSTPPLSLLRRHEMYTTRRPSMTTTAKSKKKIQIQTLHLTGVKFCFRQIQVPQQSLRHLLSLWISL